jgi:hypothetical protein
LVFANQAPKHRKIKIVGNLESHVHLFFNLVVGLPIGWKHKRTGLGIRRVVSLCQLSKRSVWS